MEISESGFELLSRHFKCFFLSCLRPCGLPSLLVTTPHVQRLCAYYPRFSLCLLDTYGNVLCDKTCSGNDVRACRFPASHWENRVTPPPSQRSLTVSWMISYLLLLNEHKEILEFGLECPRHKYSITLPHIPGFFSPFFSYDSQKNQQCYSPCTWFLQYKEKKKLWIWCLLNQVP